MNITNGLVKKITVLIMLCSLAVTNMAAASEGDRAETGTEEFWWEQYLESPEEDLRAPGVNEDGQVITHGGYILFTSDTHSATFLAKDLLEMANELVRVLVHISEDGSVNFRFLSLDPYAADDRTFTDSGGTKFGSLAAGEPKVIAQRTLPPLNDEYYRTINAARCLWITRGWDQNPETQRMSENMMTGSMLQM